MAHSSWGSGWPNCQGSKIDSGFIVSGTRFPGGMRRELVDLTSMLVQECKNRGYRFGTSSDPSYGCWGYSCRAISGSNNPSNHSWGLAVDINAPSNPYTSPLVTDMPGWMPDLWNQYGFRWGGDYSGSKDAMHYEFMESVAAAADYTSKARSAGLGGGQPIPPEPPKDWFDMATEDDLRRIIREELKTANASIPGDVWGFEQTSLVTNEQGNMAGFVLYTNQHTEPGDIGRAVWDYNLDSMVSGQPASAGSLLQYTNKNTEPEPPASPA
jgi:D-alanyl-D-alanine carboxypeptidase